MKRKANTTLRKSADRKRTEEPLLRTESLSTKPAIAMVAITLVATVVTFRIVDDYGISWDESVQSEYGEAVKSYFASLGKDRSCNDVKDHRYYGPLVDLSAALIYEFFPVEQKFTVRHAVSAGAGLLTLPAVYLFGSMLGSRWLGVVAAVFLLTLPRFVGHAFINTKDIPFACCFTWSLWSLCSHMIADEEETSSDDVSKALRCGAIVGLMACIRSGGLVMFALIYLVTSFLATEKPRHVNRSLLLFATAWLVMILPWPWAHENVLLHPIAAMKMASNFPAELPTLFEGTVVPADRLPGYYLPKFLAITTPLGILGLAVGGFIANGIRLCVDKHRTPARCCIALWIAAPVGICITLEPTVYDGIRHFLFVLPGMSLLASLGLFEIVRQLRRGTLVATCISMVIVAAPIASMVRLHPYEMTYFNSLVGGLKGAYRKYETEYWATSYREGMEWINQQPASRPGGRVRVLVAANDYSQLCAMFYAGPNVIVDASTVHRGRVLPIEYDYYLATTRYGFDESYPDASVVHTVDRDGAVFSIVKTR